MVAAYGHVPKIDLSRCGGGGPGLSTSLDVKGGDERENHELML